MFSFARCYRLMSSGSTTDKQLLSKLRKATGFSFVNCRKALQKFNNDISQAEAWLREAAQKEGWAKASKLQGRPMSQGLIGLTVHEKHAAIVEVNCETDFVARNVKFHSFVSLITSTFLQHGSSSGQSKLILDQTAFSSLLVEGQGRTIGDLTALEVGHIGENIAVRRGVFVRAEGQELISSYVHTTGPALPHSGARAQCTMGKYGALVLYCASSAPERTEPVEEIGRRLCQHIVGMSPLSIGSQEDERCSREADSASRTSADHNGVQENLVVPEHNSQFAVTDKVAVERCEDGSVDAPMKPAAEEEETQLVRQEYMLDTSLSVGAMLQQNGVTVLDFVRLECGAPDAPICAEDAGAAAAVKAAVHASAA